MFARYALQEFFSSGMWNLLEIIGLDKKNPIFFLPNEEQIFKHENYTANFETMLLFYNPYYLALK
jgi:hypothetical protein